MNKANKLILGFFVLSFLVIAALIIVYNIKLSQLEQEPSDTFFYKFDCPHCRNVEHYMEENNVTSFLKFGMMDVSRSDKEKASFNRVVQICEIPKEQVGVPLLYYNKTCYLGENEIVNFFKEEIG